MSNPAPVVAQPPAAPVVGAGTGGLSRILSIVTLTALGSAVLLAWVASDVRGSAALPFSSDGLQNIGRVLTPLILVALFIERAVEVVISAWRGQGAAARQHAVEHATGESLKFARLAQDQYKRQTQRLAFTVSLTLAVFAGLVGVRAIEPLMDLSAQGAPALAAAQTLWLFRFDVLITGLLLAGGADGIHQIVTTFTTFLDTTKQRTQNSAGGSSPAAPAVPTTPPAP